MKNGESLREKRERFGLFIAQHATMRDFTDDSIAHESHHFEGGRFVERAHHALFVPQGAAAAQYVFHHVADEALILFELAREPDEPRTFFTDENRLGRVDQFGPGPRRRKTKLCEQVFSVVEDSGVNEKGDAEDLTAILVR